MIPEELAGSADCEVDETPTVRMHLPAPRDSHPWGLFDRGWSWSQVIRGTRVLRFWRRQ